MAHPPTANKKPEPRAPLGMPRYINDRRGVAHPIRVNLDKERCWILRRSAPEEPGIEEIILTPACASEKPEDEDAYLSFLERHGGWDMMMLIEGRTTQTGRGEFFWVNSPKDLRDAGQVLKAIEDTFRTAQIGGEEELNDLHKQLQNGRLRITLKL